MGDDPSSQLESLAIREQQPSDAPTTGEERALEAEERVFDISLLRRKILRDKMELEKHIRTDEDIRTAVKDWREDPVRAERRYGHISDWDVSRVTDMSKLFYQEGEFDDDDFNEDLSRWQTGNVTDMSGMFCNASSFNSDLSQWKTGNVWNMSWMFCNARSFTSDLSQWKTANVTGMRGM